jgi:hypothetical protein
MKTLRPSRAKGPELFNDFPSDLIHAVCYLMGFYPVPRDTDSIGRYHSLAKILGRFGSDKDATIPVGAELLHLAEGQTTVWTAPTVRLQTFGWDLATGG